MSKAESAAFYEALQALLRIYQFRDRDRACYGTVTPNECYALEAIEAAGALSVGGLASALGLHKSNASRLANNLEARGFLRREDDAADGRSCCLVVTVSGAKAHGATRERVKRLHTAILAGHDPALRRSFVRLLGELAEEAAARIGTQGSCPPCVTGGGQ